MTSGRGKQRNKVGFENNHPTAVVEWNRTEVREKQSIILVIQGHRRHRPGAPLDGSGLKETAQRRELYCSM